MDLFNVLSTYNSKKYNFNLLFEILRLFLLAGVRLAMVTVIFTFLSSLSLTTFSITSLQLLSFAVVLHSPTLSRPHIASSVFLASFSLPLSGHLISLPITHLPFFSHAWPTVDQCHLLLNNMFACCRAVFSMT